MKKMAFTSGLLGVVLGGLLIPSQVLALAQLRLTDDLGNTVTVVDGDNDGVVNFNGSLGGTTNFTVNITTGISKPTLGSTTFVKMDLNSVNVTSTGGGTLTIEFTDTDFLAVAGNTAFDVDTGGTTNGTFGISWYADDANAAFAQTSLITSQGAFGPGAFSASTAGGANLTGAFSITAVATITHTGAGQVSSFDSEINAVPEPGTVLLFGTGLAGLGLWNWKRKKA